MIKPELVALFETVASLELAGDDLINPDFSVMLTEQIAFILRALPEGSRVEFEQAAREHAAQTSDPVRAELIRRTPDGLGLAPGTATRG